MHLTLSLFHLGSLLVLFFINPVMFVAALQVNDSGCGVPPQDIPLLFTKFAQSRGSSSRSSGGAGLGLAICRR